MHLRHDVAVSGVRFDGVESARPAPGVLDAIPTASSIVVCPSNPVVSIGPLLAVPGIAEALTARRDQIVGISPIVAGAALKGPADRLLTELGFEASVVGVARWYASWVGTLVIDEADAGAGRGGRGRGRTLHRGPHRHVHRRTGRLAGSNRSRRPRWLTYRPAPSPGSARRASQRIRPLGRQRGRPVSRGRRRPCRSSPSPAWARYDPVTTWPSCCGCTGCVVARTGTCVVVTQKVVSKAEGRLVAYRSRRPRRPRRSWSSPSRCGSSRRRDELIIAETSHGFICANAGVDLSNVDEGTAALLPLDSDRSARRIREALHHRHGISVGVIISDTFGRTWRKGVTDVAIGMPGSPGSSISRGRWTHRVGCSWPPRCAWPTSWPLRPSWSWARIAACPRPSCAGSTRHGSGPRRWPPRSCGRQVRICSAECRPTGLRALPAQSR